MSAWTIHEGDCLDVMRTMDAHSIDTVITDPPYGLSFMGKDWDHGVPGAPFWREALRVAKPGAMLMAFGGSRTQHRLACAIEDAGWLVKDVMIYMFGSGFPKALNISKAIDRAAGAKRGRNPDVRNGANTKHETKGTPITVGGYVGGELDCGPVTDAARTWDGWYSALKPAYEAIILAMAPLDGTFAHNAQAHGVAGLWIDGGRIGISESDRVTLDNRSGGDKGGGTSQCPEHSREIGERFTSHAQGRWPANVVLDEHAARMVDEASGEQPSRFYYTSKASRAERNNGLDCTCSVKYNTSRLGDELCQDVNMVLAELLRRATSGSTVTWSTVESGESIMGLCPSAFLSTTLTRINKITESEILSLLTPLLISESILGANCETGNGGSRAGSAGNLSASAQTITKEMGTALVHGVKSVVSKMLSTISAGDEWRRLTNVHSTVKPLDLMQYLCRLTKTPTGGVVLDPFMGSGSTGIAALREGRGFVGIELNPEYVAIARRRIEEDAPLLNIDHDERI